MPEECHSKYRVLQYLMRVSLFIQPQIEKCLIHHQAANLDSWRWSVLIQNEGSSIIRSRLLNWRSRSWFFFVMKDISITLKYKGSWPSLGFHGVIFVYICQTLMNSFWFWLLGKWATAQIQQHIFKLCTFIYCRASKKSPKLFKNQWRISTCRSHT